jgi:hypothetical protein
MEARPKALAAYAASGGLASASSARLKAAVYPQFRKCKAACELFLRCFPFTGNCGNVQREGRSAPLLVSTRYY